MSLLIKLAVSQPQFEETVNNILQRAEYKHLKNGFRDLIENAKEAIGKWILGVLEKTFSNFNNAPEVSSGLSSLFLIIGVIVFIGLMGFVLASFEKSFEKKRIVKEILGEKIDNKTTPYTLRDRSVKFSEQGDFRLGVRYSFIGLLFLMHEKNLLYLDETKTNEEVYSYLNKNKFNNLKELKSLIDTFNFSWYGHKTVDEGSYQAYSKTLELLWNEVIKHEEKSK